MTERAKPRYFTKLSRLDMATTLPNYDTYRSHVKGKLYAVPALEGPEDPRDVYVGSFRTGHKDRPEEMIPYPPQRGRIGADLG